MGLQRLLARSALRRQGWGGVGIVLVLGLGLGTGLTAVEAADRTRSAFHDYLERADVADVVVNPVLANERTEEIIGGLPGVRRVRSDSLLTGGLLKPDGSPDLDTSAFTQVRVSQDGRYLDQDRPVVREGRMIRSGDEMFLSVAAADAFDAEVGDVLDLGLFGIDPDDPFSSEPGPMVREVQVTVVGIGTFAETALPDELFPRELALITPEAAGTADCIQSVPEPDDPRDSPTLLLAAVPDGCAMTYRYYSLEIDGGQDAAAGVVAELGRRFREENRNLPAALREAGAGYFLIPSFTAEDQRSFDDALAPAVDSLRAFGAFAAITALGVAMILVLRQLRRREDELAVWRGLGLRSSSRAIALGTVPMVAALVGVLGASAVAAVASPVGPVASARALVPHPGRSLGETATVAALLAAALLGVGIAAAAWRRALRAGGPDAPSVRSRRPTPLSTSPLVALGLQAALRTRDGIAATAGVAIAVAAVTTTLVYAVAIGDLVEEPARYGWTVDDAVLVNFGYGPTDLGAVRADLDRPEVDRWAAVLVTGDVTIAGETVPTLTGRQGFDAFLAEVPVVDGRLPAGADELAVGSATAEELGLVIGDRVPIGTPFGATEATVTGLVVLPDVGPFQSDTTSLATGALLPGPTYLAAIGDAEAATTVEPAAFADSQVGIVLVEATDGADVDALDADLQEAAVGWNPFGVVVTRPSPVRPPTIVDLAAVRGLPMALAGLFAAAMVAAVLAGLAAGIRGRRRELAVVRALGATRRQRRASVRVQALATVVVGLVVGVPVGVALSRVAFRRLVDDIGVGDEVTVSVVALVVVSVGALAVAVLAAEGLARRAVVRRPIPVADGEGRPTGR